MNRAYWVRTVDPTVEPLTVAEAKQQARITGTREDGLIQSYIRAARETCEAYMNRGLLTQTWVLTLDDWAEIVSLPMASPLQNDADATPSTAPVVQYYATNGTLTTLNATGYTVDVGSRPGRIVRAVNQSWPALQADRLSGRVRITYVVGWTHPALVPERIRLGLRLYIAALEADRSGTETGSEVAEQRARSCWSDRLEWIPPDGYLGPYWNYGQVPPSWLPERG